MCNSSLGLPVQTENEIHWYTLISTIIYTCMPFLSSNLLCCSLPLHLSTLAKTCLPPFTQFPPCLFSLALPPALPHLSLLLTSNCLGLAQSLLVNNYSHPISMSILSSPNFNLPQFTNPSLWTTNDSSGGLWPVRPHIQTLLTALDCDRPKIFLSFLNSPSSGSEEDA